MAGLLHPRVIEELELRKRRHQWTPAMGGYFVPFEDGSSIQLWLEKLLGPRETPRSGPGGLCAVSQRRSFDVCRARGLWMNA